MLEISTVADDCVRPAAAQLGECRFSGDTGASGGTCATVHPAALGADPALADGTGNRLPLLMGAITGLLLLAEVGWFMSAQPARPISATLEQSQAAQALPAPFLAGDAAWDAGLADMARLKAQSAQAALPVPGVRLATAVHVEPSPAVRMPDGAGSRFLVSDRR